MRIDALCAQKFSDISRSQFSKRGKFFRIEIFEVGRKSVPRPMPKPAKFSVRFKEKWMVQYEEKMDLTDIHPWKYKLSVLQESKTWIAIEKPVGISVHPSQSDPSQKTIVNALLYQFKSLSESYDTINGQKIPRPGLVHRLDKQTSGVLLVAKTTKTHMYIQKQWSKATKIYYALVSGVPPKKGKIESGIVRDPKDRQKMKALDSQKSKKAITYFETQETKNNISLVRVQIPTGRTHQIRVHLSSIGFPIVGDEKYGGIPFKRLMLHATRLSFPDPDKNGALTEITAPLPKEFLFA